MSESSLYPSALDSSNLYEVVARLSTTLTADIAADTTTIPLASTTGFPTKGYIVIDNETIEYISVSVGSVDATGGRGHAGTATSHTNTTQVLVAVTAAVINKLRAGMIAVQTKVGISGSTDTATLEYKIKNLPAQTSATQVTNLNAQYLGGSTQGQLVVGSATSATNAVNILGVSTVAGTTAMENDIVFTPVAFDLSSPNPATLTETAGTSVAPAFKYLTFGVSDQSEAPGFLMPRAYNGQSIYIQYLCSNQTASQTYDLGIRGIAAGNANTYNPSYGSIIYLGTQTASAISNAQVLAYTTLQGASLGWAASKICYLGLIGGTVTNNVRIHNVGLRWDKG